ncbi:hypothetical protein BDN70DRAFT_921032 [Pholiota conissans]|uniref:Uncharacterized protein n=1 Tax=Pholiota conissans TaxID=109636 RepID=A0A9P5Z4I7_9AGAR|nr:hypothetical protein BDN70DRAFT_921032 [Pholiota conissans]
MHTTNPTPLAPMDKTMLKSHRQMGTQQSCCCKGVGHQMFKDAGLPEVIWDARINAVNRLHTAELHPAGYGFMIFSNKSLGLVLCNVLTVYSKGGGNHGKHGWVEDVSMITAASNIVNVPSAIEGGLQVSAEDLNLFKLLKSQPVKIANAMKAFGKRSRVTQVPVGSDGEDVED